MIHVTQASVDVLEAAVNECDSLLLLNERQNDVARGSMGRYLNDETRLKHHRERLIALRDHRMRLQALYVQITGRDPWKDIPF